MLSGTAIFVLGRSARERKDIRKITGERSSLRLEYEGAEALVEMGEAADEVLENLSVTEHLRWCALQYTMGYSAMPGEVWDRRAKQYQEEKAAGKTPEWRIGKDDVIKFKTLGVF